MREERRVMCVGVLWLCEYVSVRGVNVYGVGVCGVHGVCILVPLK